MLSLLREVKKCLPIIRSILAEVEIILLQIAATLWVIEHFFPHK
jgi:hypothetical protein